MRRLMTALLACGLIAAVAPAGVTADSGTTDKRDCSSQTGLPDTITLTGPEQLWPPNHKYRTETITATSANPFDDVKLSTTVVSDQPDNGLGDGNTSMDANPPSAMSEGTGSTSTTHQLRGERQGMIRSGRHYTIKANATFGFVRMCSETFTVTVPHDMRNG